MPITYTFFQIAKIAKIFNKLQILRILQMIFLKPQIMLITLIFNDLHRSNFQMRPSTSSGDFTDFNCRDISANGPPTTRTEKKREAQYRASPFSCLPFSQYRFSPYSTYFTRRIAQPQTLLLSRFGSKNFEFGSICRAYGVYSLATERVK